MSDIDFGFLHSLGWDAFFSSQMADFEDQETCFPARVISGGRKVIRVQARPDTVILAEVAGRLVHEAQSQVDFPSVGDWVWCEPSGPDRATIRQIFKRKTILVRKAAGSANEEQVLAANVDTVFIVSSLNNDFNVARIERYLTLVWMSGATPVVLLTKADLCENPDSFVAEVQKLAPDLLVHAISSKDGSGLNELHPYLQAGRTSVLLGSSGVGKSTLINKLFGNEVTETKDVREGDDRGRHTTTERNLWRSETGTLIIDTPGMRELQIWDDGSALETVFSDIENLALQCKFTNCKHEKEPGCRIRAALESGELSQDRLASYQKLQAELNAQKRKVDKEFASKEKQKWKKLTEEARTRGINKRKS